MEIKETYISLCTFRLIDGNTALLGQRNADDAAMKIIEEMWERL
jgi:hypothetical protein